MRRAAARTPAVSSGIRGRPSYSWPPSSMKTSPRTIAPRSAGQSTNGSSEALAGRPIRIAATGVRSRRWTTAFVKWVVPIITASTALGVPPGALPPRRPGAGPRRCWCRRRRRRSGSREDRLEVEIVAERARAHVLEALRRQQHGRRRQREHADALPVPEGLGADGLARDRVHHTDQVGRRHPGRAGEAADPELVLAP